MTEHPKSSWAEIKQALDKAIEYDPVYFCAQGLRYAADHDLPRRQLFIDQIKRPTSSVAMRYLACAIALHNKSADGVIKVRELAYAVGKDIKSADTMLKDENNAHLFDYDAENGTIKLKGMAIASSVQTEVKPVQQR